MPPKCSYSQALAPACGALVWRNCDQSPFISESVKKRLRNKVLFTLQDEEGDFSAKMSKLINCMGIQLMSAYQK